MTDEEVISRYNLIQERNRRAQEHERRKFYDLHDQCQGSRCQNSDYPKYVNKAAPDYPYCVDCATDNAMIDRRDFKAVKLALKDLLRDKSPSDAFNALLNGPFPPCDAGIVFCGECNDMARFENGICIDSKKHARTARA